MNECVRCGSALSPLRGVMGEEDAPDLCDTCWMADNGVEHFAWFALEER